MVIDLPHVLIPSMKRVVLLQVHMQVVILQAAEKFSQSAWERVNEHYYVLSRAVDEKEGAGASTDTITLSQPWMVSFFT